MTSTTKRQNDPNVFAVLHRVGRDWRGVIVRSASGRGYQPPELLAARDFASDRTAQIEGWLDQYNASQVLCVLPGSAVICRTCPLPDAPVDQLEPALRLQSEAHLFGIAPPHRLAMAVLDKAPGESARSGMILAWPESADVELPPTHRPMTFMPDIAAIAALTGEQRPTQPVIWLDRTDGTIALAVSHSDGVAFRSVREDAEDSESWSSSVGRVLAETSLNAGHTPEFVEGIVRATQEQSIDLGPQQGALICPTGVIDQADRRIDGETGDAQWWSKYGIAIGAALVRTGSLEPLSRIEHAAPVESTSPFRVVGEKLSSPRLAAQLAVLCVLFLMFGPLAANWLRMTVLELRHSDLDDQLHLVNEAQNSLMVYRELGNTAWPMTKTLSDIVSNTPEGVELEFIRVNPGRTFTVQGRARPDDERSATELVVLMQQYLRDSRIFNEITLNWGDSDAYGNYEFEMSARLVNPFYDHRYPEELDFGKVTLAERMYGPSPEQLAQRNQDGTQLPNQTLDLPPPDETTPRDVDRNGTSLNDDTRIARGEDEDPYAELYDPSGDTSRVDRPRPPRSSPAGFGGDASRRDEARGQGGIAPSQDIPDPITETQVRAMSESEVRDTLVRISTARRMARNRGDEELEARLHQEFDWLMARMRGEQ